MKKMHNRNVGIYGENIATNYLLKHGYTILGRNFYTYKGEIDIIASINDEIVFLEVKTRLNKSFGNGAESVNKRKMKHFISASKYYLYSNNIFNKKIRFDIIEIKIASGKYKINHIKNIFF